ncbi:MAG: RNA-binding protein [Candidatus Verstraetearchaeota archaeon]|nr:RNA-binding protein [Candidatus Verstraetearchaeota archaeon]
MSDTFAPPGRISRDVILVGKKPVMAYAMAALMQLTETGKTTVKARGRAISRAVDVAEIVSKRFLNGSAVVRNVSIGTEVVGNPPKNVSTIEISIAGKPASK